MRLMKLGNVEDACLEYLVSNTECVDAVVAVVAEVPRRYRQ